MFSYFYLMVFFLTLFLNGSFPEREEVEHYSDYMISEQRVKIGPNIAQNE